MEASPEEGLVEEQVETPVQDQQDETPRPTEDDSDTSSSEEESEEEVELMVTSRQKRATAGNRLTALLQQEEDIEDPEDDLTLLFQDDPAEADEGFEDADADSDVQMDSDDDDEDEGAADDDLEGEKALQKQERAEKQAKKRKLNDKIPKIFKKKVKIDPTTSRRPFQQPAPRPKKKSERASWIPTAEDAPTRASARGTTRQSKEQLHAQMVDREIKRLKQLKNMEKAQAAKEAKKKPEMTQEDRLKEAARVEKANSKSLSRWEESEMQREAEQAAKLAALKNRHLEGPVITLWSGKGEWVGGILKKVGKILEIEEPKEKPVSKKRKASEMDDDKTVTVVDSSLKETENAANKPEVPKRSETGDSGEEPSKPPENSEKKISPTPTPALDPSISATPTPPAPEPPITPIQPLPPRSSVLAPPPGLPIQAPHPPPNSLQSHPPYVLAPPALDGSSPLPGFGYNNHQYPRPPPMQYGFTPPAQYPPQQTQPQLPAIPTPPPPPPGPPPIEHAARNYLILQNFDEVAVKSKDVQTEIIFGRKFSKLPSTAKHKHAALCTITSYPAKYVDPHTGLAYCNSFAYKEIQRLKRGEYKWSKLVGAYVGPKGFAARGVPERFLNPGYKKPKDMLIDDGDGKGAEKGVLGEGSGNSGGGAK